MKIKSALVCVSAILLPLAGCGKSGERSANDTATEVDTAVVAAEMQNDVQPNDTMTEAATDAEAIKVEEAQTIMLQGLLSVNGGEDAEMLRKSCTRKALKQLNEDYEYDDYDANSLALWAINGRDGVDSPLELASLRKVGPDTYQATFKLVSGGNASVMEYKLAEEEGGWKIDSYRQIHTR